MPFFYHELTPMLFLMSILAFAGIIVIAIIAAGVIKHKKELEAYRAAVEKGLAPKPGDLAKSPSATLKSGLVWIAIGLGLFLVILAAGGTRSLALSAIPVLIGLALVISYRIEKR
jgi:hypothetical protein